MTKYTNNLNLPAPFVAAVEGDFSHPRVKNRYSVTELLKGDREIILNRRHSDEIVEDVADCVWRVFGSAVHAIIQNAGGADDEQEVKIVVPVGGGEVSGIFDMYDDGIVIDWKTASVWKVVRGDFEDWRKQLLAYAWLIHEERGEYPRGGRIVALLKDHSQSKVGEQGYPEHPVFVIDFEFEPSEIDDCGEFFDERVSRLVAYDESWDDDELPICTDEQRWAQPTRYAVMKEGRKSAVKLFDDESEADEFAVSKGAGHYVEERGGVDGKCPRYCAAHEFCSYWKERYGD